MEKQIIYKLEVAALGKLNELIEKFNKKAVKLGNSPIVFSVEKKSTTKNFKLSEHLEVTFVGSPLRVSGWEFLGTIQHVPTGNILRSVPGHKIPDSFRNVSPHCQHCEKIRTRKDSFVLSKDNGSVYKQVGRNCLRDFLGHDPDMQLRLLDVIWQLSTEEGRSSWPIAVTNAELLNMTAALALKTGFDRSTPSTAFNYLLPSSDHSKLVREGKLPDIKVTQEAIDLAKRASEWLAIEVVNNKSGFISNVYAAASMQVITLREVNLCGWAIGAYLKQVETDKMRKAQVDQRKSENEALKGSVHIGIVGQRTEMVLKLIMDKRIGTNDNGDTLHLYKFTTLEGNVVAWVTAVCLQVQENQTFTAKVTVKAHKEYNGVKETSVNRLVVQNETAILQQEQNVSSLAK
jgi:hypothetical protein